MKRLAICCLFFGTADFVSVSHADTLFEENWDSGTIDSGVWTLSADAMTNSAYVVIDAVDGDPGGTGDKALMYNGFGSWLETIESVATYNRDNNGDGLVIEFTTWVEGGFGASAQGFNGPFHNPNQTVHFTTIEFGTEWNWPSHQWSENSMFHGRCRGNPAHAGWLLWHSGTGAIDSDTYQSRFGHSQGKDIDALRVRYTLGATQGGMIEWLDENEDPPVWVPEGDFRDGTLGPVIVVQEADPMAMPPVPEITFQQGLSDSETVRLGWLTLGNASGTGNGNTELDDQTGVARDGVFIDDILVYAGAPTTIPTGACNFAGGAGGGSCQILTQAECEGQGGTYAGDDTVCLGGAIIPGNMNRDGSLDLSDVVNLLGFLFQGNPATLPCNTDAANRTLMDVNGDVATGGGIDLSDAIFLLAFLFQGGPPHVEGPDCILIVDCPPQNPACTP